MPDNVLASLHANSNMNNASLHRMILITSELDLSFILQYLSPAEEIVLRD